jgi:hypothetical protein
MRARARHSAKAERARLPLRKIRRAGSRMRASTARALRLALVSSHIPGGGPGAERVARISWPSGSSRSRASSPKRLARRRSRSPSEDTARPGVLWTMVEVAWAGLWVSAPSITVHSDRSGGTVSPRIALKSVAPRALASPTTTPGATNSEKTPSAPHRRACGSACAGLGPDLGVAPPLVRGRESLSHMIGAIHRVELDSTFIPIKRRRRVREGPLKSWKGGAIADPAFRNDTRTHAGVVPGRARSHGILNHPHSPALGSAIRARLSGGGGTTIDCVRGGSRSRSTKLGRPIEFMRAAHAGALFSVGTDTRAIKPPTRPTR